MSFIVVTVWWIAILIQLPYAQPEPEGEASIVIDISSRVVVSGFAGDDAPRSVVELGDSFDMTHVLGQIFYNELGVNPEDHSVFVTADMDVLSLMMNVTADEYREPLSQILFGTYNVPQLYFADDAGLFFPVNLQTYQCSLKKNIPIVHSE
eukprot:704230_1